jgi:hypothetical protein
MTDPFLFDTVSPRYGLPLLFSGQAQKEAFVNEAHALADALLHCAIDGETSDPPSAPENGRNWLVADGATGEWAGQDGMIACRQSDNWIFITPRDGMRVLDRSSGQDRRYWSGWKIADEVGEPIGGSTVDAEARAAISQLIAALKVAGIFPDGA